MATLARFKNDIVIYGAGTMAGAMLSRWLEVGLSPAMVAGVRKSGAPIADGVQVTNDASTITTAPQVLIIGVKPQMFDTVKDDIARIAGKDTLVISIMAAIPIEALTAALPRAGAIVRAMPNLPVATGEGVVATVGTTSTKFAKRLSALLAPLGMTYALNDEAAFNLTTALTGCGPAFVYRFAGALAGAAGRLGLQPDDADKLARATIMGAASILQRTDESTMELAAAVASPGGMTQAGLDVLDNDGRLHTLMSDTLRAAVDRGRELAEQNQKDN